MVELVDLGLRDGVSVLAGCRAEEDVKGGESMGPTRLGSLWAVGLYGEGVFEVFVRRQLRAREAEVSVNGGESRV